MGFWPVTRFPSRRTFTVKGAATSTMAPSAASSSWSENGLALRVPAASSSASLKAVTVRPATSGFLSGPAAPIRPAGPCHHASAADGRATAAAASRVAAVRETQRAAGPRAASAVMMAGEIARLKPVDS